MKNSTNLLLHSLKAFLIILLFVNSLATIAANRYWVSSGSSNWNSTSNWSTSSGGSGGASVPGSGDVAIFDGAGGNNGNCSIDLNNITVSGFSVTSGYTAAISFSSNYNFTCTGAFSLAGGSGSSFTSTSGTLEIQGDYTRNTTTFTHNSGTVKFSTNNLTISGNTTFNNLTFSVGGIATISSTTLTVSGTLTNNATTTSYVIDGGIIDAKGDVTYTDSYALGGTTLLRFSGSGDQTLTGSQRYVSATYGVLPKVEIALCPTCTLNIVDTSIIMNDFTYTSGIINSSNGKMGMYGASYNPVTITGNMTFDKFEFYTAGGCNFDILNTLTTNQKLVFSGSRNLNFLTGTLEAKGTVYISNNYLCNSQLGANAATLKINGSGNQTIIGTSGINEGGLPNVEINKSSGTLTLAGTISTACNWTHTLGTVNAGTSTVAFIGDADPHTISGNQTFYNIGFYGSGILSYTLSNSIQVDGTLTYDGPQSITLNTGTINAKGNIIINNTALAGGGSATININGITTQTVTGLSGTDKEGQGCLPQVVYTNTVTIVNTVSVANDWTRGSGGFIIAASGSTLSFSNSLTVRGSMDLVNLSFVSYDNTINVGASGSTTNITTSGKVRIRGQANGYLTNVNVYQTNSSVN